MNEHHYDAIVALLYEAALQPERWQSALLALSEAVGCNTGQMTLWDQTSRLPLFSSVSRNELSELNGEYIRHFAAIDPHTAKIREAPSGNWLNYAALFDANFVRRSEVYQDFLLPCDLRWSLGVRFDAAENTEAVFSALRGPRQEPFGAGEMSFLDRLNPHLQRAVQIQARLFQAEARAALGAAALHRLEHPLLIVDRLARVLFCNQAAESLLRAGEALRLAGGRLAPNDAAAQRALDTLLDTAVIRRHGGAMALRGKRGSDWHLVAAPLAPDQGADNPWERPLAMVLISGGPLRCKLDGNLLKTLFRLTAAEARVALALLEGQTPEEYAQAANLRIATVRSQLRELYAKTGTRRQAELVKLLAMLPAVRGFDGEGAG